ncbi:major facilitator superfamily domain-containing protein [Aspergillus californicus]
MRYCSDYYRKHDPSVIDPGGQIPELLCKVSEVQKKVAWLESALSVSLIVSDIVVTLPFSYISDLLGRKTVLFLNTLSSALLFAWILFVANFRGLPIEAIIAGPFITLFGGGDCVLMSTVLVYLTDMVGDSSRRTSYIAYVSSLSYIFSLCAPVLAAATMSVNIWLPLHLGLTMLVGSLLIIAFLPQAQPDLLRRPSSSAEDVTEETPLLRELQPPDHRDVSQERETSRFRKAWSACRTITRLIFIRIDFTYLIVITLLLAVASSSTELLPLYLSKRYNKTFAQVGYLISIKASVNAFLLVVVIGVGLKAWLQKHPHTQVDVDFIALKTSLLISAFGSLCLGLAAELWFGIIAIIIYGFGTAAGVFVLTLAKSPLVAPDDGESGRKYSILVMARTIGQLVGTPAMTALWVSTLASGGSQLGLPYLVSSFLYLAILSVAWVAHKRWKSSRET